MVSLKAQSAYSTVPTTVLLQARQAMPNRARRGGSWLLVQNVLKFPGTFDSQTNVPFCGTARWSSYGVYTQAHRAALLPEMLSKSTRYQNGTEQQQRLYVYCRAYLVHTKSSSTTAGASYR